MSLRKKPWNRVNLPVYSVSSKGVKDNMHICTYVSAVSMQPKRMMVALYDGTCTLANVLQNQEMVLQLLDANQYNLVTLLGKQSGNKVDKIARLEKRKIIHTWEEYAVLSDALAVMKLKVFNHMSGGDHHVFVCDVTHYKNLNEGTALTTTILNEKGIIRI